MVQSMLKTRKMSKEFQAKAVYAVSYQIILLIKEYGIKPRNKLGMEESLVCYVWEYLEAFHMLMRQIKCNQSQMTRVVDIFSLVMTQAPKTTSYTVYTMKKLLVVEMSSLIKKKHGIRVLKKETMILRPYMKKKNK